MSQGNGSGQETVQATQLDPKTQAHDGAPGAQLVITLHPNGAIQVASNIMNFVTMFGMLKLGDEALMDIMKQSQRQVQPATVAEMPRSKADEGRGPKVQ